MGALLGLRGGAWEWPLRDLQAGCVCPDLCSLGHLNSPSCFSYAHASFKSIFRYLPNAGTCLMPSCRVIYLFIYSFGEQSVLFGVKTSCARVLLHIFKKKSWLSKRTAHWLSFCLSVSPGFPLCLLPSARETGRGAFLATTEDGS